MSGRRGRGLLRNRRPHTREKKCEGERVFRLRTLIEPSTIITVSSTACGGKGRKKNTGLATEKKGLTKGTWDFIRNKEEFSGSKTGILMNVKGRGEVFAKVTHMKLPSLPGPKEIRSPGRRSENPQTC